MCATCGCSPDSELDHGHGHSHDGHSHTHQNILSPQTKARTKTIDFQAQILAKNDHLAAHNREWLNGQNIAALNLMSSPGSGKTTLLVETIKRLRDLIPITVIEGDQETSQDAERIRAAGCQSVQINTGTGCHLDAAMVEKAMRGLSPPRDSILFIENVGNLVCPALFDLGEHKRVVLSSVTEGEDKPIKYPHMFRSSDVLLLTKADLLPHLDFDCDKFWSFARRVNPKLQLFTLSSTRHDAGFDSWVSWLAERVKPTAFEDRGVGPTA